MLVAPPIATTVTPRGREVVAFTSCQRLDRHPVALALDQHGRRRSDLGRRYRAQAPRPAIGRISPSCATVATSRPSWNSRPVARPERARGRGRDLVVEQPPVRPERPVEPHRVVERGGLHGVSRRATPCGTTLTPMQGEVAGVRERGLVQHRVVGQLAGDADPGPGPGRVRRVLDRRRRAGSRRRSGRRWHPTRAASRRPSVRSARASTVGQPGRVLRGRRLGGGVGVLVARPRARGTRPTGRTSPGRSGAPPPVARRTSRRRGRARRRTRSAGRYARRRGSSRAASARSAPPAPSETRPSAPGRGPVPRTPAAATSAAAAPGTARPRSPRGRAAR